MVLALLAAGCIVADPPDSSDPEKTPPLLLLGQADPPVYQVKGLSTKDGSPPLQINVPVRSEDAGDQLLALLFVNWNMGLEDSAVAKVLVGPSTFDDTDRMISAVWDYTEIPTRGCTQLAMLVTHYTNYDWIHSAYINPSDVAIATWFFNVDDEPLGTNPLSGCPSPSR